MLPRAEGEISWTIDYARLRTPKEDDLENGGFGTREYSIALVQGADWEEAIELLRKEREAVARISASASDAEEFNEMAREEEGDEVLADPNEGFVVPPDLGMYAVCVALCAAGCLTAASCRGHPGNYAWADHPTVLFTADRRRTRVLETLARLAGCGLASTDDGRLNLWAPSLIEMLSLAESLIRHRQQFDALPCPRALRR